MPSTGLSEISGEQVNYKDLAPSELYAILLGNNVPPPMARKILDFNADIKNNQESEVTNDLEIVLGRKPTSLKEGLKILFGYK